jgi:hypothetical protein
MYVFKPETFEWHAGATLATWAMTLVIRRAQAPSLCAGSGRCTHLVSPGRCGPRTRWRRWTKPRPSWRRAGNGGRLGQRWKRCHSEYGPLVQAEWSVFLLVPRPQIARGLSYLYLAADGRGPRSMGRALAPQAQGSAKSRRNTHTDSGRGKVNARCSLDFVQLLGPVTDIVNGPIQTAA